MSSQKASGPQTPRVIIIGAGIGGLSFAIALKRQLGFENFTIFEKANGVGGTWRDNTYPGCSSDVGIHFYSLSTDLKSDWSSSHPFQPEIQSYWTQMSEKYSLSSHIVFGCKVIAVDWDHIEQVYHVLTEDVATREKTSTTARIVISALGILEVPKFPGIPGASEFKGHAFHSARWANVDLSGKRVAVIGNGASATQFVPIISKRPGVHITQFCRTPHYVLPPIRTAFPLWQKWAFKHVPYFMRIYRFLLYIRTEVVYFSVFSDNILRRFLTKSFKNYIIQHAPVKHHAQMIPNYVPGCKRMIFDTDYLSALHQDNIELNWNGISSIVEDGILTKNGEHLSFDVIIFATGYTADNYPLAVRGADGQTIQNYYDHKGGPTAYLGTTIPGFPNFFLLAGPNTATGHTSVIFTEEIQINYVIQLVKPILQEKVTSLEVTSEATDAYNDKIQAKLSRSVFVSCISWYRVNGTGKVNSIFPGSGALFWWWLRRPNWDHYKVAGGAFFGGESWRKSQYWKILLAILVMAGTYSLYGRLRYSGIL